MPEFWEGCFHIVTSSCKASQSRGGIGYTSRFRDCFSSTCPILIACLHLHLYVQFHSRGRSVMVAQLLPFAAKLDFSSEARLFPSAMLGLIVPFREQRSRSRAVFPLSVLVRDAMALRSLF